MNTFPKLLKKSILHSYFVVAIISLFSANSAFATSGTWNGAASSTWNAANWSASPYPGTGDTATFNANSTAVNNNTTLDLTGGVTVKTIIFDTANAAAYTIGAGGPSNQTLTLNSSGGVQMNATVANNELVNAAVVLGLSTDGAATAYTFTNNSTTNTLMFAGGITGGANSFVKTLTIAGTGNTILNGVIGNGASGTVGLSVTSAGLATFGGINTYTGATAIDGNFNLNGTLGSGGGTAITAGNNTTGETITESSMGSITGTSSFSETADTVTFSGTNNYSGATIVNGGSLTVSGANGSITSAGTLSILGAGVFSLSNSSSAATSSFGSTVASNGYVSVNNTVAGDTLALGAITRSFSTRQLGMLNLTAAGAITTTSANFNGILGAYGTGNSASYGGWITIGSGTSLAYATNSGTLSTEGGDIITSYTSATTLPTSGGGSATTNYVSSGNTTLGANFSAYTLQLTGSGQTVATGANVLTLGSLLNSGSGPMTLSGNVTAADSGVFDIVANSSATIISANLNASAKTINYGGPSAGTLTLSGTDTLGSLYINDGTVNITGTLTGSAYIVTMNTSNASLTESSTGSINGAVQVFLNSYGTTTLAGTNSFSGVFQIYGGNHTGVGELVLNSDGATGTGALTLGQSNNRTPIILDNTTSSPVTMDNSGATIYYGITYLGTGGSTLNLGAEAYTLAGAQTDTINAGTLVIGGAASGAIQVTKAGAGALTLSGANTFTGLTLNAGTVNVNNAGTSSSSALGAGGTPGTFTINGGTIDNTSGAAETLTNSLPIALAGSFGFSTSSGTAANNLNLGTGAITLSTNIPTVTLNGTGTNLTLGGTLTSSNAAAFTLTAIGAGNTLSLGSVNLAKSTAAYTDTFTGSGNISVSGAVAGGVGGTGSGLVYSGTGTLTLGGANTYTGATTVSSGALNVTGSLASGSTVSVGGSTGTTTLAGSGTINGTLSTSTAGGAVHVAPGAAPATVGILHIGSLGFAVGNGTNFDFDINTATTAGTSNDEIVMAGGTLSLGTGIVFNFDQLSSLSTTGTYTLISDTAGTISGFSAGNVSATGIGANTATFNVVGGALVVTFASNAESTNYYFTGATSNVFTLAGNYNDALSGGNTHSTALSSTSNVFLNANTASNTPDTLNTSASINSLNFVTAGTSLAGSGSVTLAATGTAGITDSAGVAGQTETVTPAVVLGSNQSWVATANSTLNVTGNVSGAQSLALTGNGTYKLGGANTFQGLTVGAGTDTPTLYLTNGSNGSATGTTTLRVNAGATLAGNGASSGTSFNISGTSTSARANLMVGLTSATDTTIGNKLTLIGSTGTSTIADANLTFNLDAKSTGSNQLSVGLTNVAFGTDAKGSVLFTLNLLNEPAIVPNGTMYTLIAGTGSTSITSGTSSGQYTGLTLGTTTTMGGVTETIVTGNNLQLAFGTSLDNTYYGANSYLVLYQNAGSNIDDIDVVVVPEPATCAMMLGGLALLVFMQRRKNKSR